MLASHVDDLEDTCKDFETLLKDLRLCKSQQQRTMLTCSR